MSFQQVPGTAGVKNTEGQSAAYLKSALATNGLAAGAFVAACSLLPSLWTLQAQGTLRATLIAYAILLFAALIVAIPRSLRFAPDPAHPVQWRLFPILFLALTVRLIAAHSPGHGFDLAINRGWAQSAAALGLARSYVEQVGGNVLPNYPPLIITLYWAAGLLHDFVFSTTPDPLFANYNILIRFPAIFADVLACVAVASVVRELGSLNAS